MRFWRNILLAGLAGLLLGALWAMVGPRRYQAHITLYFPSVQPELYLNLTRALGASPKQSLDSSNLTSPDSDDSRLAQLIFESNGAAEAALGQANLRESLVSAFRRRFRVRPVEPDSLELTLNSKSGNTARSELQALLDYYATFTSENPLSRVKKTRQLVEGRLQKQGKYLVVLEEKLSRSTSAELRQLGDVSLKKNPKVLRQLWLKRLEEEGSGSQLLTKMQMLRQTGVQKGELQDQWMKEWAQGRRGLPKPNAGLLAQPVRREELQARARLEREYYDALLKFKSTNLQHSFLLTWESLEDSSYQIIDPLSVRSLRPDFSTCCGLGLLGGLVLGWIYSLKKSAPRR